MFWTKWYNRWGTSRRRVFQTALSLHRKQLSRNRPVIWIVFLISLMLTFLVGIILNIEHNWQASRIRLNGSAAKLEIREVSRKQQRALESVFQIKAMGFCYPVGESGDYQFAYADNVCWEKLLLPALGDWEGCYPKREYEVAVSRAWLKAVGQEKLQIGDELPLNLVDASGKSLQGEEKRFRITGIFTAYGQQATSEQCYVSSKYARTHGRMQRKKAVVFVNSSLVGYYLADILYHDCEIRQKQVTEVEQQAVGRNHTVQALKAVIAYLFLFGGIAVYQVFYTILSADRSDYGLLKLLGMEKNQLFWCMRWQGIFFAVPGILVGGILGCIGQLFAVPWFMERIVAADKQVRAYMVSSVHVSPWIPVITGVLVIAELLLCFGIIGLHVCKVSPMEALRNDISVFGKRIRTLRAENYSSGRIMNSSRRIRRLAIIQHRNFRWKHLLMNLSLVLGLVFPVVVNLLTDAFLVRGASDAGHSEMAKDFMLRIQSIRLLGVIFGIFLFVVMAIMFFCILQVRTQIFMPEYRLYYQLGMTRRQIGRMFVWQGIFDFTQLLVVLALTGGILICGICMRFSLPDPVQYGVRLLCQSAGMCVLYIVSYFASYQLLSR